MLIWNLYDPPLAIGCISNFSIYFKSFIFRLPATSFLCLMMCCASCVTPWLWSNSPPQSWAPPLRHPQICSGVSCFHDLGHAPFSSWHAPLLLPACQKPSHPWCRAPCLLEAVLDHSPNSHLSGLWMALIFLCIAVWQLITHWLVAFLVQH